MLSIGKLAAGSEEYYLSAVAAGLEDYYLGPTRSALAPSRWPQSLGRLTAGLTPDLTSGVLHHHALARRLTEEHSCFDRYAVLRELAEQAQAGASVPELQAGASAFLASEAVVAVGTGRRGEMRWSTPKLLELASGYTALSRGREASAVYVVRDEEEGREPPVVTEMEDLAAKLRRSQAKELARQTRGADVAGGDPAPRWLAIQTSSGGPPRRHLGSGVTASR